ncbi:hypothetical protein J4E85_011705 [Alternaria conjuncta]|uniref:uncharacterized protein n=1 Tax=Alternaria conjuncta TaxID=181017 RepID=UPI0022203EB1|nr:uncharacterized protein J4E85_011705 [Alternaria conjuncta]KAI4908537.1 hypothetical protein J4E85_011705 [Alternaria conjuncta]
MPGTLQTPQPNAFPPGRRGVYLLTHPRSASNLFQTMMSKQPGYQNSGYKLFDGGFATLMNLEKGPLSEWPEEERNGLYETFKTAFGSLEDELEDCAKNNKQAFVKEHTIFLSGPDRLFSTVYPNDTPPALTIHPRNASPSSSSPHTHTNPTSVPDTLLLTLQPIFQIRHPILMFPSMLRAQKDSFPDMFTKPRSLYTCTTYTLKYTRALYEWYAEREATSGIVPRIIDADDIMNNPLAVRQLCLQCGLDPEAVQYEWEEKKIEDNPLMARFLSTINASKGIKPGLAARGRKLEDEKKKWAEEWNEEFADDLEDFVKKAMADYEFLWERRVTGEE